MSITTAADPARCIDAQTVPVTRAHRTAAEILTAAQEATTPILRDAVTRLPEPLDLMAGYHFGWWDRSGAPTQAKAGKMLRPALVFAAARACGDDTWAGTAAAAVELIHNLSLIHDDFLDADRTRHGRETIWSVWGIPDAVVLGDALHSHGIELLVTTLPAPTATATVARLEAAVTEMCRGQHEDCLFEQRPPVDLDTYQTMAMGKTGALIGAACALGGLCAGADLSTVTKLDTFGRNLGLAFQIIDDLLGIRGNSAKTGKPVGADLARCKQSFPVVAALHSGTDAGAQLARLYTAENMTTTTAIERAAELIEASGACALAQRTAEDAIRNALIALPHRAEATELLRLSELVVVRDR